MNKFSSLLAGAILAVALSSAALATEHEPAAAASAPAAAEMKCGAGMGKDGMKGGTGMDPAKPAVAAK